MKNRIRKADVGREVQLSLKIKNRGIAEIARGLGAERIVYGRIERVGWLGVVIDAFPYRPSSSFAAQLALRGRMYIPYYRIKHYEFSKEREKNGR